MGSWFPVCMMGIGFGGTPMPPFFRSLSKWLFLDSVAVPLLLRNMDILFLYHLPCLALPIQ
jgi:hypothetical protein